MKFDKSDIVPFWSGSSPFSNWYMESFVWDGLTFNCGEQYMMYRKAVLFNDMVIADKILAERIPRLQKALGKQVKGFVKDVWDQCCVTFVFEGLCAKFSQSQKSYDTLMAAAGKTIIEASPSDQIWGVGLAANDPRILDTDTWRGQNLLGGTLMRVCRLFVAQQARAHQPHQLSVLDSCK